MASPVAFVPQIDESVISGYLYKKTREGRWQKRWFETNGVYLTYYKSRKMEKLLAALSLPQIGEIKTIPAELDPERQIGLFSLELNTRIYTLRAKSDEEALLWVTTLNKIKQQGILATHNQVHQQANGGIQSLEVDSEEKKSETSADWLKTGRSCFGCC